MTTQITTTKPISATRRGARGPWIPALSLALIAALWLMATDLAGIPEYTFPSIYSVASAWWEALVQGRLFVDIAVSMQRLLLGSAVGIISAIVLGFLVGLSPAARIAVEPIINAFSGIAGIAWIPLALAWFGTGLGMSTFVIWNGMFFVVFANTALGVSRVPESYRSAVSTLGGGRWEILRSVVFPGALPDILTGVRVGLAFAWRSLIAAELMGSPMGLGQFVNEAATYQRTDRILAGCITIAVLGVLLEAVVVSWIAKRTVVRWGTIVDAAARS
jgi:ABC-type nitrate/sulfonate/bicarbonate transport system permease component